MAKCIYPPIFYSLYVINLERVEGQRLYLFNLLLV